MDELTPIFRIEYFLDAIINDSANPYTPAHRIEYYLAKIAGANVEIPDPAFRIEYYLAKLCGENVEIPTPVFRIEFWLAKKCGMDVETPEPAFRIEFWLDEWANGGGDIPIDPTRISAYITTSNKWTPEDGSYTVCVPVTVGETYIMEFSTTADSVVGKIFRYGFSDTNSPTSQTLTQAVRSTPQATPRATVTADKPYLVLQFGASVAQSVIEDGYFSLKKADRTSPIVGIGQVGYMTI